MSNLPKNSFKASLVRGDQQIGLWAALASPYTTELVALAGYDWLLIDAEHAPNDVPSTLAQLQAVASAQHVCGVDKSNPVVRLPVGVGEVGTTLLKQYLDIGAQTVLVPMIDTAAQAAQVVAATRYAPAGVRGMGSALARASRWQAYDRYVHQADDEVCVLVQLETVTALSNLEAIAAVPGVDGLFIGPADLSASMGYRGNATHPEVLNAVSDAIRRICDSGKAAGILATNHELASRWLTEGASFVAVGADSMLLASAARDLLARFRTVTPRGPNGY